MPGHVSRNDYPNEPLSEGLEVVSGEVLKEVVLLLVQNCKRLCSMIVFLHRLVTVADRSVRDEVHVVGIGEAIVGVVMANGRYADREAVELAQLRKLDHLALRQKQVTHLEDVEGMHVIVILHVASVAFVDLANESRELGLVHLR